MSDTTIASFIEVNKRIFAMCRDEQEARAHIASFPGEDAQQIAESLWGIERVERLMAAAAEHEKAGRVAQSA